LEDIGPSRRGPGRNNPECGKRLSNGGFWNLVIANPDGCEDFFEGALTIGSQAQIKSVNPRSLVAGIPDALLQVRARCFSGEAYLIIEGPSEIPVTKLNQVEEGVFEFSLNLGDALEGLYSVSLINPSGKIDTRNKGLKISSPKISSPHPQSR